MVDEDFYYKGKKKYLRVTNILKTIHSQDLENLRRVRGFNYVDAIFKEASDKGKRFHNAMRIVAEDKFNGMIENAYSENSPDIYNDIILAREWFKKNIEKVLFKEKTFYDDNLFFAGTPDIVVRFKGQKGWTLIDYKTGSIISPIHFLQLAAYTHLIEINNKIKISKRIIMHVHKGKIKIIHMKGKKEVDVNTFFYVLFLHNCMKKP